MILEIYSSSKSELLVRLWEPRVLVNIRSTYRFLDYLLSVY